ncbi:MAG TPA: hypothetical protein VMH00_06175 [Candidatus Limnocylindrales bacterium]|nr:hypothetical protein [Candidatus Limnocylindrales bacterium]
MSSVIQVVVALIGFAGVVTVGWWEFGRNKTLTPHLYAINVKDVATMSPIEHAQVTLAWPTHNDLKPTGSDGEASFQVLGTDKPIRAHVYVTAEGYTSQDRDVDIPLIDSNDIFTLARQGRPEPAHVAFTKLFSSGTVLSGVMKGWSPWYTVQADAPPPGYEVDLDPGKTRFEVSGDRNCNSWGVCEWADHTPHGVSFRFMLQGHDEWPYPGQVPGIGYLYVAYKPISQ